MPTLPDLPQKNKRREANLDGRVATWFEKNHPQSVLVEVKMKGRKLTENQQKLVNKTARTRKFKYKFPDGGRRTPLDYIIVKDLDVAVVICDESGKCECTINNDYKWNIKV